MGFLWTKQAAILDNISNSETPNYKAKIVTFEEELRAKLQQAHFTRTPRATVRRVLSDVQPEVVERQDATRMDENGVNVTEQSAEMIRNAYQLRYVYNAINSDLSLLRMAVRGQ